MVGLGKRETWLDLILKRNKFSGPTSQLISSDLGTLILRITSLAKWVGMWPVLLLLPFYHLRPKTASVRGKRWQAPISSRDEMAEQPWGLTTLKSERSWLTNSLGVSFIFWGTDFLLLVHTHLHSIHPPTWLRAINFRGNLTSDPF